MLGKKKKEPQQEERRGEDHLRGGKADVFRMPELLQRYMGLGSAHCRCALGGTGWAQPLCNKPWWVHQMKREGRHTTHSRSVQS